MAYEKRTWVSGTTPCSAENFNHMEDGIAAANEGVDKLNTDLRSNVINLERTSGAWLSESYKSYDVCYYKIPEDGLYIAIGYVAISETKTDRVYYCSININGSDVSKNTQIGNNAYPIQCPVSAIINCKAGDIIKTTAQANYVAENYAGLASGVLRLIKLHS